MDQTPSANVKEGLIPLNRELGEKKEGSAVFIFSDVGEWERGKGRGQRKEVQERMGGVMAG